jgi:hypothetical protein
VKLNKGLIITIFMYCSGYAPGVTGVNTGKLNHPVPDSTEILVFLPSQHLPDSCKEISKISIINQQPSQGCSFRNVLELAKQSAREAGGNIIYITAINGPKTWHDCYEIDATVLFRKNMRFIDKIKDSVKKQKFGDTLKYAILYVCRPDKFAGSIIGYDIQLGNLVICRAKNNSTYAIKVFKEGNATVSGEYNSNISSVDLNVKFGQEYYVQCSLLFGGKPKLELVDNYLGEYEYNSITGKRNEK